MVKISVKDLLRRALMVGAREVRLIPGRRTIVITDAGENEVRGDTQTPERINAMLESVLTQDARRSLSTGFAEWTFDLPEHGPVHVTAELRMGLVHASFNLDGPSMRHDGAGATFGANTGSPSLSAAGLAGAGFGGQGFGAAGLSGVAPTVGAPQAIAVPPFGREGLGREGLGREGLGREGQGAADEFSQPLVPPLQAAPAHHQNPTQPSLRKVDTFGEPSPRDGGARNDGFLREAVSGGTGAIDRLLRKMVELKASDLHICVGAPPMLRLDGDMVPMAGEGPLDPNEVRQVVWPIVPPRNQNEFEETKDTDFAYEISGLARFRSNVFVDLRGMGAVFRVIPSKILTVEQLGLPTELLSLCNLAKGLVVVTGPTGSGKSTTLAALIDYINRSRKSHIITIEDPVEFVHQNQMSLLNQRQVGEHTRSFKAALRAALREDPDIVLLGEMRDLETISIAIETAETGHLVFGTLHTSSAPSTIDRIIDQFPTNQQNQVRTMLSGSLKGVIAQMLCKKKGGGRVAALEVMMGVPAIANLIREGKIFQIPSVMQTSRNIGMRMMNDSLFDLVKSGKVEADEALSKSNEKSTLQTMLRQAGISFSATA